MAEHGYFVREMNSGIAEYEAAGGPLHSAIVHAGETRCTCSKT